MFEPLVLVGGPLPALQPTNITKVEANPLNPPGMGAHERVVSTCELDGEPEPSPSRVSVIRGCGHHAPTAAKQAAPLLATFWLKIREGPLRSGRLLMDERNPAPL